MKNQGVLCRMFVRNWSNVVGLERSLRFFEGISIVL